MSVAVLSRDFTGTFPYLTPGGCLYYRGVLPLSVSGQHGSYGLPAWDGLRGWGVKETVGTGIFGFSTIMLKLIMDRSTPRQIELAQQRGQRIIVDVDDYYEGLTEANDAYERTHPDKNKLQNRGHYQRVIERCDTLTVSTPFLYEHYRQSHPDVRMVRNGVNQYMFDNTRRSRNRLTLGWTGATNYRNNDLEQLRDWLPDFLEDHDLRFHHAGHQPDKPSFAEITGVNPKRVSTSPLVDLAHYPDGFQFDIGIVPLNDIPFNHAKSNIKGLEYVAAGIAFVASDTPEYRILHEGGIGSLARSPEEWAAAVTALLNQQNRKHTVKREYGILERDWSIQARAKDWQNVFATAAS